jgi:hypothetical protein|tara:strand:- start:228 stop:449 length:222 start_codon:yes stop_codon:yes gene_type:complete
MTYTEEDMHMNPPSNKEIYYNPPCEKDDLIETNEELNSLDKMCNYFDNLCVMSHFCTISNLDEYVDFMRTHLD